LLILGPVKYEVYGTAWQTVIVEIEHLLAQLEQGDVTDTRLE
jgi:hypothetical protein